MLITTQKIELIFNLHHIDRNFESRGITWNGKYIRNRAEKKRYLIVDETRKTMKGERKAFDLIELIEKLPLIAFGRTIVE